MCKRGVEKETAAGRDGDKGELGAGFQSLRGTHRVGDGVQIPREDFDGNRQQLAGGGRESQEGEAKLGMAGKGIWQGGRRPQGVMDILHCRDTGGSALRVGNVGSDKEDGKGPWTVFSPGSRGSSLGGSRGAGRAGRTGPGTTLRWRDK